jgi:hypothetical protein
MRKIKPIAAICGKGGVSKTVFSALFARALRSTGVKPFKYDSAFKTTKHFSTNEKKENFILWVSTNFTCIRHYHEIFKVLEAVDIYSIPHPLAAGWLISK